MNTAEAPSWLPSPLIPFFTLSYPIPRPPNPDSFHDSHYYQTGILDGCIIITCIAVMAVLRDLTRLKLMIPFARWKLTRDLRLKYQKTSAAKAKANGVANGNGHAASANGFTISRGENRRMNHNITRFGEQGWPVVYYSAQWCFGAYVHSRLPTQLLDPIGVFLDHPHIPIPGTVKFYYLLQTAFYMHQVLILNAEEHRKDHWQMMLHHFITITVMIASYFYNFTRIGVLIMVLMDWCDIWLPVAKMCRYLQYKTVCDAMFLFFLASWIVTRHVFFNLVIKATWQSWDIMPQTWEPMRGFYFTSEVYWAFLGMLIALQILQLVWFGMAIRVLYRVVTGQGAEDTRSDDEGEDESEEERKKIQ